MSAIDRNLSRRNLLASLTGIAALPAEMPAAAAGTIRPFKVEPSDDEPGDLRRRINATRWPGRETNPSKASATFKSRR